MRYAIIIGALIALFAFSAPAQAQQVSKLCVPITDTSTGVTRTYCNDATPSNPEPVGESYGASLVSAITGSFSGTGTSATFTPIAGRPFYVTFTGSGVATIEMRANFNGSTYTAFFIGAGGTLTQINQWVYAGSALTSEVSLSQSGVSVELVCTGYTSGTVSYTISQ